MKPTSDDEFITLNNTLGDCLMKYLGTMVPENIQQQLANALLDIFHENMIPSDKFSSTEENKKDIHVTTGPAYASTTSTERPEQLEFILKYENELF